MSVAEIFELVGNVLGSQMSSLFAGGILQVMLFGIIFGIVIGLPGAILVSCLQRLACLPEADMEKVQPTLSEAEIERNFPQRMLPASTLIGRPSCCAICLEPIDNCQPVRVLQCDHTFHSLCITEWWTHEPRRCIQCPLCRREQDMILNLETGLCRKSRTSGCTCLSIHRQPAMSP
mmetsp:Transcript_94438/g.185206  ORF Transcript_94438/g.185206 Transcript_94438/m.185206 type:complete len:176 (-) Transcript_94438:68-595(-)